MVDIVFEFISTFSDYMSLHIAGTSCSLSPVSEPGQGGVAPFRTGIRKKKFVGRP